VTPPPAGSFDRREPLPSLSKLPGHLLRQLSPGWRRAVLVLLGVIFAGLVVTAIILGPQIAESNKERAAQERKEARQAEARERARLIAEQRPRFGRVAAGTPLVAGVEEAITRDARARHATGELKTPVLRTDCKPISHGSAIQLSCTAITSDVPESGAGGALVVGYPYGAAVTRSTRRYAICKTSGRPGEGSFTHKAPVELPAACGGER
jgi:type II secretory pathway pseudopilin PulG